MRNIFYLLTILLSFDISTLKAYSPLEGLSEVDPFPSKTTLITLPFEGNKLCLIKDSKETLINVDQNPEAMAISKEGVVYVANFGKNTVSVIQDGIKEQDIAVGINPIALALFNSPKGVILYVANFGDGTVSVIENDVKKEVIAVGKKPIALALTKGGTTLYVANYIDKTVNIIENGIKTYVLPIGNLPIKLIPVKDDVYVIGKTGQSAKLITAEHKIQDISFFSCLAPTVLVSLKDLVYISSNLPPYCVLAIRNNRQVGQPIEVKGGSITALDVSKDILYVLTSTHLNLIKHGERSAFQSIQIAYGGLNSLAVTEDDTAYVGHYKSISVIKNGEVKETIKLSETPKAIAILPANRELKLFENKLNQARKISDLKDILVTFS